MYAKITNFLDCIKTLFEENLDTASVSGAPNLNVCPLARLLLQLLSLYYYCYAYYYYYCC